MNKLVSVVMPSYNEGKFLEKSINSILAQTYDNIEIIVVDSSDDEQTLGILNRYADKIKCIHQKPKGVAAALNLGLSYAKGAYIARMDADDISLPQRISMQVKFLEENDEVDIVGTECDVIDGEGNKINEIAPGYYCDSEIKAKLIFENCIMHPTVMFRKELLQKGFHYDESFYAEDLELWTRLATTGINFANMRERLVLYRYMVGNMSSNEKKVAPAAARAAKKYAIQMFGLTNEKYQDEDFTRPYYTSIIESNKSHFIISQFKLLRDIHNGNRLINEEKLNRELNDRWQWAFNYYGRDITSMCNRECFCPQVPNNVFILDKIREKLHIFEESDLLSILSNILSINEKYILEQKHRQLRVSIYGMGIRGKKVLEAFEGKFKEGELEWQLISIADNKTIEVEFCERKMVTINKEELVEQNPDVVIISSNKYYEEIVEQLRDSGLKSRIIDSGWII